MSELAIAEPVAEKELTLEEKVDYLFSQAKRMESLLENVEPQVMGLIAQAGPMLESLAPLLGQASSPMGRIMGSFLR